MTINLDWLRHALLEWIRGLVAGFITAILLVGITFQFPALEDYGVDIGLRLKVWCERLSKEPIAPDSSSPRYVFLDIDPGGGGGDGTALTESSIGACCALENRKRGVTDRAPRYVVQPTGSCSITTLPSFNAYSNLGIAMARPLHCEPTRPLNRFLLAEILNTLQALDEQQEENAASPTNIRAIVLNVALAPDSATHTEDKVLIPAMALWEEREKPIIFAADAVLPLPNNEFVVNIQADQGAYYHGETGIAFPVADSAVRRYRRCFVNSTNGRFIESLPYKVARVTNPGLTECGKQNSLEIEDKPRIMYSFPGLDAHADSDTRAWESSQLIPIYQRVYIRCLAENLWNRDSQCSQAYTYKNAIVVIGASNPLRRDRHFTPLGDMSGAEVVINTTRSFLLYPPEEKHTFLEKVSKKIWLAIVCSLVWLGYFLLRHRMNSFHAATPLQKLQRGIKKFILFLAALVIVITTALLYSYRPENQPPNLDVLIPVLAVGLELYADFLSKASLAAVKSIKAFFNWSFRHGSPHGKE